MRWEIAKNNREPVWVETITGRYIGTNKGSPHESYIQQTFYRALNDLFQKSREELLASKLLKSIQSEEIQTVNNKRPTDLVDEKSENQTEKNSNKLQPTPDQIKLAIFPFHINRWGVKYGGPVKEPTLRALCHALKVNNKLFPIYSYYDIGDEFETNLIDQNLISVDDSEKLWVKKPFSRKIPNIDLSCEIGRKLGVDVVLLVSIVTGRSGSYDVGYYFINIHDNSVFKRGGGFHPSRFDDNILIYTKSYFEEYGKMD